MLASFAAALSLILGLLTATMPRSFRWQRNVCLAFFAGVVANTIALVLLAGSGSHAIALRLLLYRCVPFAIGFGAALQLRSLRARGRGGVVAQEAPTGNAK